MLERQGKARNHEFLGFRRAEKSHQLSFRELYIYSYNTDEY